MTDRIKTTISPSTEAHAIGERLKNMSGMSLSGLYTLGLLTLASRHSGALEHGAKKVDLLRSIREQVEEEIAQAYRDAGLKYPESQG